MRNMLFLLMSLLIYPRAVVLGILCFPCLFIISAEAQTLHDQAYPSGRYWVALNRYYDGEYLDAVKDFHSEWRTSMKFGADRWVDSTCYAAMAGECYYQAGKYPEALEQFRLALELQCKYSIWMTRVHDTLPVGPRGALSIKTPWNDPMPGRVIANVPDKMAVRFGNTDQENYNVAKYGGTLVQQTLRQMHVDEINRCTALAIMRYGELLGPLALDDQLLNRLIPILNMRPAPPNSWLQTWIDVHLGMTFMVLDKDSEAIKWLQRGALLGGKMVHPLSPITFLALGNISIKNQEYAKAAGYYLEAATCAYYQPEPDYLVMRDALAGHSLANRQLSRPDISPTLLAAELWSRQKRLNMFRAGILVSLSQECWVKKNALQAQKYLEDAVNALGRRSAINGTLGAHIRFTQASIGGKDSVKALEIALNFFRDSSLRNFQLRLVDRDCVQNKIPVRRALLFYDMLMKDPADNEWILRPAQSLAFLLTPHPLSYKNWFMANLDVGRPERALEVSDLAKRARYIQTQPYGGRLQALRWILESSDAQLTDAQRIQRQSLLTLYPSYVTNKKKISDLRVRLAQIPIADITDEQVAKQNDLMIQIGMLSEKQETILKDMVMEPLRIDIPFPPVMPVKAVQKKLQRGHAVLAFHSTGDKMFAFLFNSTKFIYWEIKQNDMKALISSLNKMYQEIGISSTSGKIPAARLTSLNWKSSSMQVMKHLITGSGANFEKSDFPELIIVPDGVLWYMPFEMLHVNVPVRGIRPTISLFRIRYAPLVGMTVPYRYEPGAFRGSAGFVFSKNYTPSQTWLEQMMKQMPYACLITPQMMGINKKNSVKGGVGNISGGISSALYATRFNTLVILDELKTPGNYYALAPVPYDAGRSGSFISDWYKLPWGHPRVVILAGLHTLAEGMGANTKKNRPASVVPGDDLFFTSLALMDSGADTVILSRWNMGGGASAILAKLFLLRLRETSAADAWRNAVLILAESEILASDEPKIDAGGAKWIRGTIPALWGGYMVLDSGKVNTPDENLPIPGAVDHVPGILPPHPIKKVNPPMLAPPDIPL